MAGIDDLLELSGTEPEGVSPRETREERKARREEERASKGTTDPSYIMSLIGRYSGSDVAKGLTSADFLRPSDLPPINVGTYGGRTFSAPIFATGGMLMNFGAIQKSRDAQIQADKERAKAGSALDYQVYEIKDQLRNSVLIDKQLEAYDNLVASVMSDRGTDANEAKRYLNEEGNELMRREGIKWNNFAGMLDETFDAYHKVLNDQTLPPSQRIYGPETLALAEQFTEFIAEPENFDYDDMSRFSRFYGQFKESISMMDMANAASENFKVEKKDELIDLGIKAGEEVYAIRTFVDKAYGRDAIIKTYGDERWSEEQKDRFYDIFLNQIDRSEKYSSLKSSMTPEEFVRREREKAKVRQEFEKKEETIIQPEKETSIGRKTGVDEEGNDIVEWSSFTKYGVVELGQNKHMQISLYGAITKDTREEILEEKNVDFLPMDTGIHYEVVREDGIGSGKNKIAEKGEWITKDSEDYRNIELLIKHGVISPDDIKAIRYVEGTYTTIEPLGSEKGTRSVFIRHDKIAGTLENKNMYPGLSEKIKEAESQEPERELYTQGKKAILNNRPIILKEDGWYYEDGDKEKVETKK